MSRFLLDSQGTFRASLLARRYKASDADVVFMICDHVARIQWCIDILDNGALDQLREIVNRVTTLELRGSDKVV